MGEVVNLRPARKSAERQRDQMLAAANRVKYGRSKLERALDAARTAKARREFDRHRVETGDER
jgi:Domain of unknown function (DUF4169)